MSLYDWQKQEADGRKAVYTINLRPDELTEPGRCYSYGPNHGVSNTIPKITIWSPFWEEEFAPNPELDVSFNVVVHRDKQGAFVPHLYIHTIGPDFLLELEDVVEEMPEIYITLQSIYDNREDILHSLEKIVADALSYKSELILEINPHDGLDTARITFLSPHLRSMATVEWPKIKQFFVERKLRDLNVDCPDGSDNVDCENCEHCTS